MITFTQEDRSFIDEVTFTPYLQEVPPGSFLWRGFSNIPNQPYAYLSKEKLYVQPESFTSGFSFIYPRELNKGQYVAYFIGDKDGVVMSGEESFIQEVTKSYPNFQEGAGFFILEKRKFIPLNMNQPLPSLEEFPEYEEFSFSSEFAYNMEGKRISTTRKREINSLSLNIIADGADSQDVERLLEYPLFYFTRPGLSYPGLKLKSGFYSINSFSFENLATLTSLVRVKVEMTLVEDWDQEGFIEIWSYAELDQESSYGALLEIFTDYLTLRNNERV